MWVLDSNTISYYFHGDPLVVPRMQALRPADVGVPAIVEYELRYGLLRLSSPP
jgi:tRNA(fMet)-specific endonuclease VapC